MFRGKENGVWFTSQKQNKDSGKKVVWWGDNSAVFVVQKKNEEDAFNSINDPIAFDKRHLKTYADVVHKISGMW